MNNSNTPSVNPDPSSMKTMNDNNGFCQCLYEIENDLERTQHCFMPCEDQKRILASRSKPPDPSVLIVSGDKTMNKTVEETLNEMYRLGMEHALQLVKMFPIPEAISRMESLINKPSNA